MAPPSKLDLTGRASEDERISRPTTARSAKRKKTTRQPNTCSTLALNPLQSLVAPYLPSPIDLYNQFTPLSLLQLPFILILFLILQLPLHLNATTLSSDTIHSLSENEWAARVENVNKMERELKVMEKKVGKQKRDQKELRGDVDSLRRRLGKIQEKREIREEWVRIHGMPVKAVESMASADGVKDD